MENKTNTALTKDLDEIAKEIGLTHMQKMFCEAYFFVTNRDVMEAYDLAGYAISTKRESFETDKLFEKYVDMEKTRRCTELMNNPKIRRYITAISKAREEYITVDKFWVINKLKKLADTAPENVQLNATKLLGQNLDMFNTSSLNVHTDLESPDKAMQKIWAMRRAKEEAKKTSNEDTKGE